MYYVYRYFLNAVNDSEILLKAKIGVIGYLILKHLDMQCWLENGKTLTFTQQVDLAHLYSRQFEHSYTNFEVYNGYFKTKRRYAWSQAYGISGYRVSRYSINAREHSGR